MRLQAELSLYPLQQADPARPIDRFIRELAHPELVVEPGSMSTLIGGPADAVFAAIRRAYEATAADTRCVLVVKLMNEGLRPAPVAGQDTD